MTETAVYAPKMANSDGAMLPVGAFPSITTNKSPAITRRTVSVFVNSRKAVGPCSSAITIPGLRAVYSYRLLESTDEWDLGYSSRSPSVGVGSGSGSGSSRTSVGVGVGPPSVGVGVPSGVPPESASLLPKMSVSMVFS